MTQTKLAVDIGGTFTDIVLDIAGSRFTKKILTTPSAPEVALIEGSRQLLKEANATFSDVDLFVHGTTLATNAILERRGAKTALLATAGFRDVLEIATESRFDQYDLKIELPKPLIPRDLRFGIEERIGAAGDVLVPLNTSQLLAVTRQLRDAGVESVAIAFLHSYANVAHERLAAELVQRELPHVTVTVSGEVCPEIKEYERTSTAAANAYVQPLMDRYLGRMLGKLEEENFNGSLYLVTSSGTLTTVETARQFPVRLVESGPAGGAIYASSLARALGERQVLSFDMGGTTAKVCIIKSYSPLKGRTFEVDRTRRFRKGSGLPIRIPVTEMVEIGAGGGSIASVDALRNVSVGPESASSDPGPACFNRGGLQPTVTDADLLLGLLDPKAFAGGTLKLAIGPAQEAFERHVGSKAGMDAQEAAYAVYEIVCENMASAARAHAVEIGESLTDFTMIAFGGAAPLHAARVAEKLGIRRVLIPPNAGLGSAIGFLSAPVAYELVRSCWLQLDNFDFKAANALLDSMASDARGIVQTSRRNVELHEERKAFVRYAGQSNEMEVPLPTRPLTADDAHALRAAFEQAYTKQYSRVIPGAPLEVLNWSVRVAENTGTHDDDVFRPSSTASLEEFAARRRVFEPGKRQWLDVEAVSRAGMVQGHPVTGPALVVEKDTTTFVTASFDASVDHVGCIALNSSRSPISS